MIGWWHARRGWLLLVLALLSCVAIAATRQIQLLLPNVVSGGTNTFPIAYVIAFVPGLFWIVVVENRPTMLEAASVRRAGLLFLDFLAALAPPALSFGVLMATGEPDIQGAGRNVVLVSAASVVAAEIVATQFAFLIPLGYLLLAGTSGFAFRAARPSDWALVLDLWEPARDIPVMIIILMVASAVITSSRLQPDKCRFSWGAPR